MNDLRSRYRSLPMSRTYRFLIVQTSTKGFKLHFKKQKKIEKSLKLSCKLTVAYETSGAFLMEECFWLDCGLAQFNSLLTSLTNSIIFHGSAATYCLISYFGILGHFQFFLLELKIGEILNHTYLAAFLPLAIAVFFLSVLRLTPSLLSLVFTFYLIILSAPFRIKNIF